MSQRRARKNLQVAYTTRQESSDKTQMWDINDPRAHKIHTRIGEMIALDYHPFSIVDNVGFIYLLCSLEPKYVIPSRRYITETVMPTIYDIYILTN